MTLVQRELARSTTPLQTPRTRPHLPCFSLCSRSVVPGEVATRLRISLYHYFLHFQLSSITRPMFRSWTPPIKPFAKPLVTDTLSPKLMQNPNSGPPADTTSSVARYLPARFRSIILACLDANLPRSAAFYAERYFALDNKCHDALHLYSTSLLRCGQTQSALWLVSPPYQKDPCPECRVVQADCYTALGQHAQAGAALEASLQESPLSDIGNVQ